MSRSAAIYAILSLPATRQSAEVRLIIVIGHFDGSLSRWIPLSFSVTCRRCLHPFTALNELDVSPGASPRYTNARFGPNAEG
jgi:hypothetical protein